MLEFEKKILLTEKEYHFLKEHRYAAGKTAVQINHYYDTDDFRLNQKGTTCRIREKDGKFTAAVKKHQIQRPDCSLESSCAVKDQWDASPFREADMKYQGSLQTVRTSCELSPELAVMLDQNSYLGTVDYELELEYTQNAEGLALEEMNKLIGDLIAHRVIDDAEQFRSRLSRGENKSARFFSKKKEIAAGAGED